MDPLPCSCNGHRPLLALSLSGAQVESPFIRASKSKTRKIHRISVFNRRFA